MRRESIATRAARHRSQHVTSRYGVGRFRSQMTAVILQIKVKPRAKTSGLSKAADGTWIAKLKAPPVDGKANEELVRLVAEAFGCNRAAVTIKAGATGRTKLVKVET